MINILAFSISNGAPSVDAKLIPLFSGLLWEYYDEPELVLLCEIYSIALPDGRTSLPAKHDFLALCKQLFLEIESGNSWAFLNMLIEQIESRNATAIANTSNEQEVAHRNHKAAILQLCAGLAQEGLQSEIAVLATNPFSAKAELREFLEKATTPILVVDPYVGLATLDCLRLVTTPIRLLTATGSAALEAGFANSLAEFIAEGRTIEVRRAIGLHDRHLLFNGRCWLVGSSLKDAGKKSFHCTEIVDTKISVETDLETRWKSASAFP